MTKKSASATRKARIFYARVDEFWRREQKYAYLDEKQHIGNIEWQELKPDAKHTWLTEGLESDFDSFLPLGTKEAKPRRRSMKNQ
jgi:predicted helicase